MGKRLMSPSISSTTTSEQMVKQDQTKSGGTVKGSFENGRYFVSVEGQVLGIPQKRFDDYVGEFVITEDPQRHKFPLVFRATEGVYPIGLFTGSFSGAYTTKLLSLNEVIPYLQTEKGVQLRFMYYPAEYLSDEDRTVQSMFNAFLQDDWTIPNGVTLVPDGVGVIQ